MDREKRNEIPWNAARFHVIGEGHVIAPHVILPFAQSQNAAQHFARVNANAHVYIYTGRFSHLTCLLIRFNNYFFLSREKWN